MISKASFLSNEGTTANTSEKKLFNNKPFPTL
jgi:hypothetical protein